jgi:hypothetical protein
LYRYNTVSCVKLGADPSDRSSAGRPFCFRIISPNASLLLQAESNEEIQSWIRDLQGVIAELINLGPSVGGNGLGGRKTVGGGGDDYDDDNIKRGGGGGGGPAPREVLSGVPGNLRCADCGRQSPGGAVQVANPQLTHSLKTPGFTTLEPVK